MSFDTCSAGGLPGPDFISAPCGYDEPDRSLASLFGGKTPLDERFAAANWFRGESGAPLLEDAASIAALLASPTSAAIRCWDLNRTTRSIATFLDRPSAPVRWWLMLRQALAGV
jgi:hypothetical protein